MIDGVTMAHKIGQLQGRYSIPDDDESLQWLYQAATTLVTNPSGNGKEEKE